MHRLVHGDRTDRGHHHLGSGIDISPPEIHQAPSKHWSHKASHTCQRPRCNKHCHSVHARHCQTIVSGGSLHRLQRSGTRETTRLEPTANLSFKARAGGTIGLVAKGCTSHCCLGTPALCNAVGHSCTAHYKPIGQHQRPWPSKVEKEQRAQQSSALVSLRPAYVLLE